MTPEEKEATLRQLREALRANRPSRRLTMEQLTERAMADARRLLAELGLETGPDEPPEEGGQ